MLSITADGDLGLFADLDIEVLPDVPGLLRRFTAAISTAEVSAESFRLLSIWLRARTEPGWKPTWVDGKASCEEQPALFFPDFPDPDDYDEGELAFEFRRRDTEATIEMAAAKSLCSTCPLRLQCLARDLKVDGPYEDRYPDFSFDAVIGGWGTGARRAIESKFQEVRRSYLRGIRDQQSGSTSKHGMNIARREELEELAARL